MFRSVSVFMLLSTCAYAQAAELSGLVMDGSIGIPLAGATVTLHDAGLVATTDAKGQYRFEVNAVASVASVSQARLDGDPSADVISFSKDGYGSISRSAKSADGTENVVLTLEDKVTYVCSTADAKGRWQIARTVYDPQTKTSVITYLTDTEQWNFKPNFSPDGSKMTFFRRYVANGPCCATWRSSVCVMNADGSGLHEIIEGEESFNTEPYWSRDGSNRISFNRMNVENAGPFWNDASGNPGEEQRIGPWGWVNPHLADGRVFIQRKGNSYLATPAGDTSGTAAYVQVRRPDDKFIHKIALSQDESMIAYQKWVDPNHNMYKGGVMVYAKFDASVPAITDEVIFDELDPTTMAWYVSISTDNKFLLFAKDGAIMQHDVEKGTTMKVSADSDPYKAYPTYTTFSK
ncbi:MAG: PD40 domain-containing protein [Planctomycetaceae bacterium]|nr:PD40 domain-containing protein [Planctomycetales bacterium]MCB9926847.1 PD40 domain-containing protein [Planctomycetaceae bacterium]